MIIDGFVDEVHLFCFSVSGRIAHQTGPGGLPEWLADLAPKEPRVRRAPFWDSGGDGSGIVTWRKTYENLWISYENL